MWLTNLWGNIVCKSNLTSGGMDFLWLLYVTIINMWKIHQEICMAKGWDWEKELVSGWEARKKCVLIFFLHVCPKSKL